MYDALDPAKKNIISVRQYDEMVVQSGFGTARQAPPSWCPVCKMEMKPRAGQTNANRHFYHVDDKFCPTKDPARRPYLGLMPRVVDQAAATANVQFTIQNLELIYAQLNVIVPLLDFKEFINILDEAKRLNVYGYANLVAEYIPYVFVTLINFLPSTSLAKKRALKFMFFYDDGIRTIEDLWIHRGFRSNLYRISYSGATPQKVVSIELSTEYLLGAPKMLSQAQRNWCLKFLNK
jgi:hypothetical protein